jgi:large subunit ribosomal protein L28
MDDNRHNEDYDIEYPVNDLRRHEFYDSMVSHMAKVCAITKKGSIVGGGYSNVVRATKFNPTGKSRKYPNLQNKRIYVPELKKFFPLTLSTTAIKTINKKGAYAVLKKAGVIK